MKQTCRFQNPKLTQQFGGGGCEAITQRGTRCQRCIGPKGRGGKTVGAVCHACWQHRQQECDSKAMKPVYAQKQAFSQLGTSGGFYKAQYKPVDGVAWSQAGKRKKGGKAAAAGGYAALAGKKK